jgi:hypothetical protein
MRADLMRADLMQIAPEGRERASASDTPWR